MNKIRSIADIVNDVEPPKVYSSEIERIYDLYLWGDFLNLVNEIAKYGDFNFFRDLATMLHRRAKRKRNVKAIYKHIVDLYFDTMNIWIYYFNY